MTQLTITHLRFDCAVTATIKLGPHNAGQRLRDAIAAVLRRAVCPEHGQNGQLDPEHVAVCPVCRLLAGDTDPGRVRRAYSIVPPYEDVDIVRTGEQFSFGVTLYGHGMRYLPYIVLAAREVGRVGIGPGRGTFDLHAIWAGNPLSGEIEPVMVPGETMVHTPQNATLTWDDVTTATDRLRTSLNGSSQLRLRFRTPTRLVFDGGLISTADFGVFFRRLLQRIDQIREQFAEGEQRPFDEIERLHVLADRVRTVRDETRWQEVSSWSGRQQSRQWLSGIVGTATYRAREWEDLLPWLVLGQATQAGKLTAKGNGVCEIIVPEMEPYWAWLARELNAQPAA